MFYGNHFFDEYKRGNLNGPAHVQIDLVIQQKFLSKIGAHSTV